jgi:peptide/nickel transport system permease protein
VLRLILARILTLPFVLFGVSVILFLVSQVLPGDPIALIVGKFVPANVRVAMTIKYGFNKPLITQYGLYLDRVFHGNLGTSIRYDLPVSTILRQALPATLILVAAAALITIVLTFVFGFLSARYKNTWIDYLTRGIALLGTSTAPFILAIACILVFGIYLHWLPISGRGTPPDIQHLILPAFVLGFPDAGHSIRTFRASLIDSMGQDYVRAARARGIGAKSILFRHAGVNSLGPTVTVIGLNVARIAGSVVLVETVFSYPGIGQVLETGIFYNDFPLLAGGLLALLIYTIVVTLIVDVVYHMIDPRAREVV